MAVAKSGKRLKPKKSVNIEDPKGNTTPDTMAWTASKQQVSLC